MQDGFGHGPGCSVRLLSNDRLADHQAYESALVFRLPEPITAFMNDLRTRYPLRAPAADQLSPHVTVVYLGVMPAPSLRALKTYLQPHLDGMTAEVAISGFGTFGVAPAPRNWHLTLASAAPLAAVRARLSAICMAVGWRPPPSQYGLAFTPHLTIWDRFTGALPERVEASLPGQPFRLADLIHIGRGATEVANV
jgi:2'-5' RNA ligase